MTNEKAKIPVQLRIGKRLFLRIAIAKVSAFWILGFTFSVRQQGWMLVFGIFGVRFCIANYVHDTQGKAPERVSVSNEWPSEIYYKEKHHKHKCDTSKKTHKWHA